MFKYDRVLVSAMFAGSPVNPVYKTIPAMFPLERITVRRSVVLLLVLGSLFLLDIATTQVILLMGGVELNPLMEGIVANPVVHLLLKAGILLVIFIVSLIAEQRVRGSGSFFYCVLITLYFFVVLNNLFVLLPRIL
jgi:hypothetical protein